jgi:hypothetical protein
MPDEDYTYKSLLGAYSGIEDYRLKVSITLAPLA